MDDVFTNLAPTLTQHGVVIDGSALSYYTRLDENGIDVQVGFPVQTGEAGSRPDGASAEAGDSAVQPNDAAAQPNPLAGGVTIPLSPTERVVEASELPAGRVAVRSYIGGYDGLGNAWGQFMQDVAAQGEKPSRTFWEVYCTEPTPDGDPSQNRTDLMVLLDAAH